MKSVLSMAERLYLYVLDALFPEYCLGCAGRGIAFCADCIQKLPHSIEEASPNTFALYNYKDPIVKKAIWNIKYYRRSGLGKILGRLLYEGHIEEIGIMRILCLGRRILVIPVPLSRERYKKRGYNQAEMIASGFCACDSMFELQNKIVVKKINTPPQARISNRKERLGNIAGAFTLLHANKIKGRTIIVIDDVTTTGGTLQEIIHLLEKSGAKKVYGFAIAH